MELLKQATKATLSEEDLDPLAAGGAPGQPLLPELPSTEEVLAEVRGAGSGASSLGDAVVPEYEDWRASVEQQTLQLRVILEAAEAKDQERDWLRNQATGELDDSKLVDGIVGEKLIYRRRGQPDKKHGLLQAKPKRIVFAVDCSRSMARGNSWDQRLDRMTQAVVLLMEAIDGFEHKFSYSIVGHSGRTAALPLVDFGRPPQTQAERMEVVSAIRQHARSCPSGDSTLACLQQSVPVAAAEDADDHLVFVLSDANLGENHNYGDGYDIPLSPTPNLLLPSLCLSLPLCLCLSDIPFPRPLISLCLSLCLSISLCLSL